MHTKKVKRRTLPVNEYAGHCIVFVVPLQNPLYLNSIWHLVKLTHNNRDCILLQHPQRLCPKRFCMRAIAQRIVCTDRLLAIAVLPRTAYQLNAYL